MTKEDNIESKSQGCLSGFDQNAYNRDKDFCKNVREKNRSFSGNKSAFFPNPKIKRTKIRSPTPTVKQLTYVAAHGVLNLC